MCTKYKELVNAHLPIPELNRKEQNDDDADDDHDIDDDNDAHQEGGE